MGNRTECALLQLVESLGVSYAEVREAAAPRVMRQFPFSSDRKRMSTVVETRGGDGGAAAARLHLKGAAELVLDLCATRVQQDGSVQVHLSRNDLASLVEPFGADYVSNSLGSAYT